MVAPSAVLAHFGADLSMFTRTKMVGRRATYTNKFLEENS